MGQEDSETGRKSDHFVPGASLNRIKRGLYLGPGGRGGPCGRARGTNMNEARICPPSRRGRGLGKKKKRESGTRVAGAVSFPEWGVSPRPTHQHQGPITPGRLEDRRKGRIRGPGHLDPSRCFPTAGGAVVQGCISGDRGAKGVQGGAKLAKGKKVGSAWGELNNEKKWTKGPSDFL